MTLATEVLEHWDGASVGTTVSTSNSAADNISGTAAHTFSNDFTYNGQNMMKAVAAANFCVLRFDYSPSAEGWRHFPFVHTSTAGMTGAVAIAVSESSTGTKGCDLRLNTDGTLSLRDAGSSTRWTSSAVLAANTKYYIALRVNAAANGGHRVKIYNGTTGALIEDSGAQTNAGFSLTTPARFKIGPLSSTTLTAYWGEITADPTNEIPPPVAESATAIITSVTTTTVIDGSTSDGDTALTQLSGPSTTITELSEGVWEVEYSLPLASDIELRLRATSSGGTVTDDEFYTIPSSGVVYSPVAARKTFDGTVWK